jgi:riboflavin kinase/FMN adenylyltransferase
MHVAADPRLLPLAPRALARGCAVTLGNFDGVHLGHQGLIRRAIARGRARGLPAVVITFDPHPLRVVRGKDAPPQLISLQHKLECFAGLGVDLTLVLPFTGETAGLSPEDFVRGVLVECLHTRTLVVGYDYAFGRNRRGDASLLAELGEALGFAVEVFPPLRAGNGIVSSTRVREALLRGDARGAAALLGRPHSVDGVIVKGMNRGGRLLGFPTANLELSEDLLLPKAGVYAVLAELNPKRHSLPGAVFDSGGLFLNGVANVGSNPTFGGDSIRVETHLLDFHADIYGAPFRVRFIERLREERAFSGVTELIEQIRLDAARARELLPGPSALRGGRTAAGSWSAASNSAGGSLL